jgi:YD repeat-containing protein
MERSQPSDRQPTCSSSPTAGTDEAGNLTTRQDLNQGLTETFGYDALERLTSATGPGGTLTVAYDTIGNITSRSDVGSYT